MEKKQQVRAIFQVGAWLAFIMLGYLGIRSYKLSVEKLKTNKCIEEIETLSRGIQFYFQGQRDYGEFNYKQAVSFKLIPKDMFKEGFTEATNAYMGGVDFFYSSLTSNHAISLWPMKRLMSVWTSWKASAAATATTVRSYGNSGKRRNGRRRPGGAKRRQC